MPPGTLKGLLLLFISLATLYVYKLSFKFNSFLPGLLNNILWTQYIVQYNIIYCKAKKILYFYLLKNGQQYIDNIILSIPD